MPIDEFDEDLEDDDDYFDDMTDDDTAEYMSYSDADPGL